MLRKIVASVVVAAAVMGSPVEAQDAAAQEVLPMTTNPAKRTVFRGEKTVEAQQSDQLYCYRWASTETGWDPEVEFKKIEAEHGEALAKMQGTQGAAVRGAAGGALAGLAIGAIAGDAGKGAAIGAVAGGVIRGSRARRGRAATEDAFEKVVAEFKASFAEWDSHWVACMTGKDYGVGSPTAP